MEVQRHVLRRSRTVNCFHSRLAAELVTTGLTTKQQRPDATNSAIVRSTSTPLALHKKLARARSWALLPFVDITISSPESELWEEDFGASGSPSDDAPPLATAALDDPSALHFSPALSLQTPSSSSSSLPATLPLQDSLPSPITPLAPWIEGITSSPLTYEALFALILSINIRELIGNGADAIVKALIKKAVTLAAALFLAVLLDLVTNTSVDWIASLEPEVMMEIRNMLGVVSGWVGQQASDPWSWQLELRVAEWLWPRPRRRASIVSAPPFVPPITLQLSSEDTHPNSESISSRMAMISEPISRRSSSAGDILIIPTVTGMITSPLMV